MKKRGIALLIVIVTIASWFLSDGFAAAEKAQGSAAATGKTRASQFEEALKAARGEK
jgi:hypothetical protein